MSIPKFLRPEVVPVVSLEMITARLTDSAPPAAPCPWCPGFDPSVNTNGGSHPMCQACRDKLIFEAMKRAEQRDDDDRDELCGSTCGAACGRCGRCS